MEAVPRMPMIWLDLKEAGEFPFSPSVKQFILKNYGENPDNYNEQLKKLETLRQSAVNVTRDFEGCSTLRKYFGQLHYVQSRVPMGTGQEAAVPISWTEIFSGKTVTHDDISYEQACILYNLGALHSMLGAMDNRVSEEGMKVSCTHFQCSAGAFSYLRDHFSHNFSVDMSHQILNLNINLMLGQAQECLLEKSMLDNRKSFLVARISAQVVDYYKEACRALENSETASMLGKIQKDWKKLVQMKIYYFASIAHLHMGKQAEEQQKYGERLAYLQSSMDKLTEAIKLAKGQPDSVQDALRFTMDVIGGKFNSAKKDNDFIYHETVPSLETLASVKGAPLVKALPVNPTDPSVTGPDLFAKLVPMAAHEASSLYSEEKAKLLRDIMMRIESKNETLEQFMDSLGLEPESVDNLDMYSHIPPVLMEKCAALSVRPDTVKSLIQSMQGLSGVFTDVESSLKEIRDVLEADEAGRRALLEAGGPAAAEVHPAAQAQALAEICRDLEKYMEAHEKASFTNTELHRAMHLHISNLLIWGLKYIRILGKVQEMRDQRSSLEKQLRDLIQHDDITSTLVTTERADMRRIFEEQLKKYEQVKVYLDQNLAAQENILKALTEANVQYASVRKGLSQTEQQWNGTVHGLVGSYEAYEDLMKKSQEGKEFYDDLEAKASRLLERAKTLCETRAEERKPRRTQIFSLYPSVVCLLPRETQKKPPARPTAAKPSLKPKAPDVDSAFFAPHALLARIMHPQMPNQAAVSGYRPPPPQAPQPGLVAPTPIRPSTATVASIQAPIPSPPPQPQQQKQPYPQPIGHPMPQGYQPGPGAILGPHPHLQAPQGYLHGYMPPQPGVPPHYQQVFPGQLQPHQQNGYQPQPHQTQPPHSGGVCYPGGAPLMPQQPLAPQPAAPQQPQAPLPMTHPQPPAIYPSAPGANVPATPAPGGAAPPTLPSPSAVSPSTSLFQRQKSSTDDLLSSSPESQPGGPKAPTNVLQPTKADPQDGERRKKSSQGVLLIQGDPYQAPERVARLHGELERYRSRVDSLEHPSESEGGLSVLDARWKELQDQQERDARQLSIAIARCYTMKNRHQDVMPYDLNRVVLQSGKDDYINASYVEDLSPYCPRLIATQAPLTGTAADFWLLVYEQKVSLVVMLVSEQELEKGKVMRYFPTERGQQLAQGPITLCLTTQKTTPTHVERMISLQYRDQSLKRTVVHLQFTSWPELGLPDSKSNLLSFIQEVHGHYLHQRPLHTPVVVHCSSGVGRTGVFCLLYAALQELEAGNGIPDLPLLVKKMRQQRKNMLQEKLHLKFCHEAVLKHAELVLQRHGVTTCSKSTSASQQDIVLGGDMPISSIQATIAKLSIRPPSATDPTMEAACGPEDAVPLGDATPLQEPFPPTVPRPPSSFSPPLSPPTCSPPPPNGLDASPSTTPPPNPGDVPPPAPAPSSLELLAALTPEAFSMEGGGKGKQRVTKQSFLQPAEGQGLHGTRGKEGDDPLSSLDPLWSLGKR
uniref:Tyrosine-protein phosphatase non-receptor type 23 n=1 Tax=Cyclopterus lumpus TaxID=8103 RepID=A0A8C2XBD3_CYCLU